VDQPRKLKGAELKAFRLELLAKQGSKCAICNEFCPEDKAVLDHCHKGGQVRAVLHRGCNALLGKVENNAPRYGVKLERLISFLAGASAYIDTHRENATGLIHPSHRTPEEKAARRKAKAKRERTKQ
jgi:hypothetical protein